MSGAGPRRLWNFHRLAPPWAERVVREARIRPGELVVDLGAGTGALTFPILRSGARVIAVEVHPGRAAALRARTPAAQVAVLTVDLAEFTFPGRRCRVVANPPFSLAARLIRAIARSRHVHRADLVLPADVVDRYVAGRRVRGMTATRGSSVPAAAFTPRAPRSCAVLRLRRR